MKKHRFLWIILLLVVFIVGAGFSALSYFNFGRGQKEKPYFDETVMIEKTSFDEFTSEIINLIKEYDGSKIDEEAFSTPYYSRRLIVQGVGQELELTSYRAKIVVHGPDDIYIMQFTTKEAAKAAYMKLQETENIKYCEPDQYVRSLEGDEDYKAMSWGVKKIGADSYAKYVQSLTDDSIMVAVVDSGVYKHSFIKDRIVNGGMDLVDNDMNPDDEFGHGTHVAGTIVDCTPELNVKIIPVRVLGANGYGSWLRISLGIRYAVSRGAQIVNLSLGNKGQKGISQTVDNAVLYAINRGCTVVAAAGNDNWDVADCSIAHLDRCIVVAAVDESLKRADFQNWGSNWGQSIDVAAPGVNIVSCIPNRVGNFTFGGNKRADEGTSMATPHISALAAMIKLKNPSWTPSDIEKEIINHCVDLGEVGWDQYYGWGIPDFSKALDNVTADTMETNEKENNVDPIEILDSSPEENVQIKPKDIYEDILEEYKMLAENNFDRSFWERAKYANEGVCNFNIMGPYSVYYKILDLADDGNPELLISINEEGAPKNIVDIFAIQDGVPVGLIESNGSVGYRSRFYVCVDNRIKNVGSSGALNTEIIYYKLPANSAYLELDEQYIYDGWDGDRYTYTDNNGNSVSISGEEYEYKYSKADIEEENDWILLSGQSIDNVEIIMNESENNSGVSAYQGIFMQGDTFLSLPLYTSYEPGGAIGVVYCVTKPEWSTNGVIVSDVIETVGEIYAIDSQSRYEVRNGDTTYDLLYYDGEVVLEGDSLYDGTYIQVSNSGANMNPSDIWLDLMHNDISGKKTETENDGNAAETIMGTWQQRWDIPDSTGSSMMITTVEVTFYKDGTYIWKAHNEIIGNGTVNNPNPVSEGTYYIENGLVYMSNVPEDFVIPLEDILME